MDKGHGFIRILIEATFSEGHNNGMSLNVISNRPVGNIIDDLLYFKAFGLFIRTILPSQRLSMIFQKGLFDTKSADKGTF